MKKRIFFAIKVSDDIKKKVKAFSKSSNNSSLNWLTLDDLHITILPPWDEEKIDDVLEKMNDVNIDLKSFQLVFNHITLGPYYDNPKLIWAKGKSTKELFQLKEYLEKKFDQYSDRKFKLHLTLAKFAKDKAKEIVNSWENKNISWTQNVSKIVLFESVLDTHGVRYKAIKEIEI